MNTSTRLLTAYQQAQRIPFDDQSKFILFSDVHRADNSLSDDFAHNQNIYMHALNYYFDEGFTYIEVGDGDELWEHSQFKHIRHAHSATFMILRKYFNAGRLIMLFGNHNMSYRSKSYVKRHLTKYFDEHIEHEDFLFPGINILEAVVLQHASSGGEVFITHGHQGDLINDQLWRFTKALNRHFWHYLKIVGFRNPASPAKNFNRRHKIEKNLSKWIAKYKKMMIVGHTHRPKFSINPDIPYFNTGSCVYPRNITGIEIDCGKITLVDWRISANEDGNLYIRRKPIAGPASIHHYMFVD